MNKSRSMNKIRLIGQKSACIKLSSFKLPRCGLLGNGGFFVLAPCRQQHNLASSASWTEVTSTALSKRHSETVYIKLTTLDLKEAHKRFHPRENSGD
jgi:hypothetical protein